MKDYISGEANKRYIYDEQEEDGFAWAGQVVGLIHDSPPVSVLFDRIIKEAETMHQNLTK